MNGFWGRHWFKAVGALLVVAVIGGVFYQTVGSKRSTYKKVQPAPDFTLTDTAGKTVTLNSTAGKARLLYFFYSTCPDVCTPTTFLMSQVQDLLKAQDAFGTKTAFYSITIDPEKDTPERLKTFAATFHADLSAWSFLRGDQQTVFDLASKGYKVGAAKDDQGNLMHFNLIVLIDKKGFVRNWYNASDPELTAQKMADDLMTLTKE